MKYFLSRQTDGRIVLDRQQLGELIEEIEVDDPPTEKRWVESENGLEHLDVPQYWASYYEALGLVNTLEFDHYPQWGWFERREDGKRPAAAI